MTTNVPGLRHGQPQPLAPSRVRRPIRWGWSGGGAWRACHWGRWWRSRAPRPRPRWVPDRPRAHRRPATPGRGRAGRRSCPTRPGRARPAPGTRWWRGCGHGGLGPVQCDPGSGLADLDGVHHCGAHLAAVAAQPQGEQLFLGGQDRAGGVGLAAVHDVRGLPVRAAQHIRLTQVPWYPDGHGRPVRTCHTCHVARNPPGSEGHGRRRPGDARPHQRPPWRPSLSSHQRPTASLVRPHRRGDQCVDGNVPAAHAPACMALAWADDSRRVRMRVC